MHFLQKMLFPCQCSTLLRAHLFTYVQQFEFQILALQSHIYLYLWHQMSPDSLYPTEHFPIFEHHDPSINDFYLVQRGRPTYLKATNKPKLRYGSFTSSSTNTHSYIGIPKMQVHIFSKDKFLPVVVAVVRRVYLKLRANSKPSTLLLMMEWAKLTL